ncbi:MAG: hypothetical protein ACREI2_15065 [Nitrospiraceae bacterium]
MQARRAFVVVVIVARTREHATTTIKLPRWDQRLLAAGATVPGARVAGNGRLLPYRARREARNGFGKVGVLRQFGSALLGHVQHLRHFVHANQIGNVRLIKGTVKIIYRLDFDPNYAA